MEAHFEDVASEDINSNWILLSKNMSMRNEQVRWNVEIT